ncbi:MAG: GWxTD domain-containing protein [bacterium]|nr:GWxTD domain-containing protein [bacterium]
MSQRPKQRSAAHNILISAKYPLLLLMLLLTIGGLCRCGKSKPPLYGTVPGEISFPEKSSSRMHLSLIMSPEEHQSFVRITDKRELDLWLEEFWRVRDPSPTTPVNERREEHLRRLKLALDIYTSVDPPGFDHRGRDYIMFGPPDQVYFEPVDILTYVNGNRLTWVWSDLMYMMTYEQHLTTSEYFEAAGKYVSLQTVRRENKGEDLGPIMSQLQYSSPAPYPINKQTMMRASLQKAVKNGEVHSTLFTDNQPLWSVFAMDCFRSQTAAMRVDVSYQIRLNDLEFKRKPGHNRWEAGLLQSCTLFDSLGTAVSEVSNKIRFDRRTEEPENQGQLFSGLMVHEILPGEYSAALRLEDMQGDALQIYTTKVTVPDLGDSLRLSDIAFASAINGNAEPKLFRKGEWNIFPHPLRSYNKHHPLSVYFEIYNLATDAHGLNDYRLSYRILEAKRESTSGWLLNFDRDSIDISSTLANRQAGGQSVHPLTISVDDLDPGGYILEITVEDRLGKQQAVRRERFAVSDAIKLGGH